MKTYEVLTVYGEPVAKARPRATRGGHIYTPTKTRDAENAIRREWQSESRSRIEDGPVTVRLRFYLQTPKSWGKIRKELAEEQEIRPLKVPDIDNLVKTVLDALNGLAWEDDKQICRIAASKYYSATPRTEITVMEL